MHFPNGVIKAQIPNKHNILDWRIASINKRKACGNHEKVTTIFYCGTASNK